jgi:hypothetical protein
VRRQFSSRIRSILAASILALTSLALAASAALADGTGGIIPH